MEIKVLGIGCVKCKALEKSVLEAVSEMKIQADVKKVQDILEILNYDLLQTPGLVINDKLVSSGHLLSVSQVKTLIEKNL
jgi:small redox-active disulfide protein 2